MIAADAGVDPALVLHYYGNKADLFAAAVHMPVAPSEEFAFVTDVDRDQLGEALLRNLLGLWDDPDALAAWLGLLRSAMSDQRAMQMLREFLVEVVFETIGAALGDAGDDVDLRLSLVASQVVGLGLARHVVGLEPLASASTDDLVDAVAPNLQRYLTGELGSDTAGS